MQARLHVSGEGVSSQRFSYKILCCLRRLESIAVKLNTEQVNLCEETPSPGALCAPTTPTRGEVKKGAAGHVRSPRRANG